MTLLYPIARCLRELFVKAGRLSGFLRQFRFFRFPNGAFCDMIALRNLHYCRWEIAMEYTARMNEHALVSRAAAAGSCVLLKNVANTLPFAGTLDAPVRVAVFGIGQIFTPTGLSGMDPWRRVGILDGLSADSAVAQDTLLAHKYRAWDAGRCGTHPPRHPAGCSAFPRAGGRTCCSRRRK